MVNIQIHTYWQLFKQCNELTTKSMGDTVKVDFINGMAKSLMRKVPLVKDQNYLFFCLLLTEL